jgi:HEAT repeat protein
MLDVMLTSLLLAAALSVAHADPPVDLVQAADAEAPESARMAAFDRLVRDGTNNLAHIRGVALAGDADTRQRWVAIRALGMVRGDGPREALLVLLDDEQPAIRAAAVQALGDLGDRETAVVIASKLQDPAVIVRAGAAEALGKIRDQGSVQALSDAVMARDNYYRGSSLWVRRHFVTSLGEIGSREAVPTLLRTLDDGDEGVRQASVKALESVAGFSYADGRDLEQQREAWRRWAQAQLR